MNKETIETIITNLAKKAITLNEKKLEMEIFMPILAIVCFISTLKILV